VRPKVLIALNMNTIVLWDVISCNLKRETDVSEKLQPSSPAYRIKAQVSEMSINMYHTIFTTIQRP
jgi:hypothetical protein